MPRTKEHSMIRITVQPALGAFVSSILLVAGQASALPIPVGSELDISATAAADARTGRRRRRVPSSGRAPRSARWPRRSSPRASPATPPWRPRRLARDVLGFGEHRRRDR
jgi:hypothetical protein